MKGLRRPGWAFVLALSWTDKSAIRGPLSFKPRAEPNDIELKMAIALGAGLTVEKTAALIGRSESTVYANKDHDRVRMWIGFTRLCMQDSVEHQVSISSEAIKAQWEKRRGKALDVHDKIMDRIEDQPALALKAAEMVFDRADGRSVQTNRIEASSSVTITHTIDSQLLEYWESQAKALANLSVSVLGPGEAKEPLQLSSPSVEAIEAEVV